jgi:hypothetical protein
LIGKQTRKLVSFGDGVANTPLSDADDVTVSSASFQSVLTLRGLCKLKSESVWQQSTSSIRHVLEVEVISGSIAAQLSSLYNE